LTIAFSDPVLREEGLKSDRLGDTMEFFGLNDNDAHRLLCDCRYYGAMTGERVAERLRRHAQRQEFRTRVMNAIGRFFGRTARGAGRRGQPTARPLSASDPCRNKATGPTAMPRLRRAARCGPKVRRAPADPRGFS